MNRIDRFLLAFGRMFTMVLVHALKFIFWLPKLTIDLYDGRVDAIEKARNTGACVSMWILQILVIVIAMNPRMPPLNALIFWAVTYSAFGGLYFLRRPVTVNDPTDYNSAM